MVDNGSAVYCWGNNQSSPKILQHFLGVQISHASAGAEHSLFVCDGDVFSWGNGKNGRLGHGDTMKKMRPKRIPGIPEPIGAVAAGGAHSIALSKDCQHVYTWGCGGNGRLGHGDIDDRLTPTVLASLSNQVVKQVAAGGSHSLALCDGGTWGCVVYCWGLGSQGQLGTGGTQDYFIPTVVPTMLGKHIKHVVGGGCWSAAVSDTELYTWGCGADGQLGHGDNSDSLVPRQVEELSGKRIEQFAAGSAHAVAICDREVFSWGDGGQGQLGHGDLASYNVPTIVEVFSGKKTAMVAAGSHHTIFKTEREIMSCGSDSWGQLGVGPANNKAPSNIPVAILGFPAREIKQLSAGGFQSLAVFEAETQLEEAAPQPAEQTKDANPCQQAMENKIALQQLNQTMKELHQEQVRTNELLAQLLATRAL
eukprot:TRINITY_DN57923_c0_g1_i1.p1 TRINITY_DN57923_c0_g1~~TRINITY_DN57923_c0_g1_i1.p1  ORF type:complete len:429 (-),score=37.68 TRINITY_DN57923_c0_g1_i1:538-1803(-)